MEINELEQIALAGDVDLQYKLGMMYEEENDVKKAIDFLTMAAKNGHNDAMNELGVMYCSGEVVEKNYQEGIRWLEEAAEHDNSDACGNLGMMYLKGISFKTDPQKALGYFIKSANLGNEHAMQQVAEMYSEGIGTEKNEAVAQEWMEKIKEQEIYQKIEELCQSGEAAFDDDELESALEYYLEAWDLIPQPRGGYEGTGWVAAAIGEVLFEQEKYKESFDYYEEAYYAIGGKLNPYINFMMGKCLYLLNKKKKRLLIYIWHMNWMEKLFLKTKIQCLLSWRNNSF